MKRKLAVFLGFLLGMSTLSWAQSEADQQTGIAPFGAYDGGAIDAVNLRNGVVNIKIPLLSYPQRGGKLTLNFNLYYVNKVMGLRKICTPAQPSLPAECETDWFASNANEDVTLLIKDDQDIKANPVRVTIPTQTPTYYSIAEWTDPDGSLHAGQPIDNGTNHPTTQRAVDGSGMTLDLSLSGTCSTNCASHDAKGLIYYPSIPQGQTYDVIRADSNGNQITRGQSNAGYTGTYTDTFGRQIPVPIPTTDFTNCSGPLTTTSASLWQVPGYNGGNLVYKFCMASVQINIPPSSSNDGYNSPVTVLQSIILPNQQAWTFEHSNNADGTNYGETTKIDFPTGGSIAYSNTLSGDQSTATLLSRTETSAQGAVSGTTQYVFGVGSGSSPFVTTVTDAAGNDIVHTLMNQNVDIETERTTYQGRLSGGQVLKDVKTVYYLQWASAVVGTNGVQGYFPQTVTTTIGAVVSQKTMSYCCTFTYAARLGTPSGTANYGLISDSKAYDFGTGSPGALLREEQSSYYFQTNPQYLTDNLLNLISTHSVLSPTGATVAQQTMAYDEGNLVATSGLPQHAASLTVKHGNLTTATAWLSGGTNPASRTIWYDTGEPSQVIDPRSNATTFLYSSAYAGALPTTVTNAKNQSATYTYDFNLGVKLTAQDPNLQTTSWSYDALGRTTGITRPNVFPGTSTHSHGTICYDDVAGTCTATSPVNAVVVTETVNPTTNLQVEEQVDGFGRKTLTRLLSDPDGITYGLTSYDLLGRVSQTWNPSRCALTTATTTCAGETTFGITTHSYDGLGREVLVVPPDGSASANNETTAYSGNLTTVTDQAGVSRQSTTDAQGRLTQVSEVNMGWITQYQYDTLGNLLCAEQHGGVSGTGCSSAPGNDATSPWRVRRFTYDTLSRLLTSNNPETGLLTYTYDAAGNVLTKTDARGITINYSSANFPIDVLNRVQQKTYSNGEPAVSYTYDSSSAALGIGRRTGMTDASGLTNWGFDPTGAVATEARTTNGITKMLTTSYDLTGSPYQVFYPSGSTVQYVTGAAGRTLTATDITHGINYVSGVHYSPAGSLSTGIYGMVSGGFAGINLANTFNDRLQPVSLQATAGSTTLLHLGYNFGVGSNDNGNVQGITNYKDSTRSQTFSYDGANRLLTAQSGTWGVKLTTDAWGNMTQTSGISGSGLLNPMPVPADLAANVQNKLTSSLVSYTYAPGGNMTYDGNSAYGFNAESQISSGAGVSYAYDGDGERMSKSSGTMYWSSLAESDLSGNITSEYVFVDGQRVARRDAATGNVFYYLQDHLGSSSVVSNATGVIQNESDFYPFGGEKVITQNLTNQKYKFTGKERDTETGSDYFGARYYTSTLGRFLSPDWAAKAEPIPYAKLDNPQSLNLYAYAQGNEETLADHDGHLVTPWEMWSGGWGSSRGAELTSQLAEAQMDAMTYDMAQNQAAHAFADKAAEPKHYDGRMYWAQQQNSQAVSTVYNETGGLKPDPSSDPNSAANLQTARKNVAHVYKNTKGKGFQSIDHLSGREKAALAHGNPDSVAAYSSSEQAVAAANRDRVDPTGGATHIYLYDLSPNSTQHVPAWVTSGNPTTVEGPFINAAGGGDVRVGAPVLILTIKDH